MAGDFHYDYVHRRPGPNGSTRLYVGGFEGRYSVALRWVHDRRNGWYLIEGHWR